MRIAVVDQGVDPLRGRPTVAELLSRPVASLALDLSELGHVVRHVRRTTEAPRPEDQHPQLPPGAASGSRVRRVDVLPGRELSVLRAFRPDAVLGVGETAGRVLDDLMRGMRVPWTWTPGGEQRRPDEDAWFPSTAARVVVGTPAACDAARRAGFPHSRCDVAAWQLASAEGLDRGDRRRLVRTVMTVADPGGESVADVVRALVLLPALHAVVVVDPAAAQLPSSLRRWRSLAAGLGVGDRLRLVRVGSATEIRSLMAVCEILVSVGRGAPELELIATALRCGLPIVASDHPDVRGLVETGVTGLLLPPGDVRRLARALHVVSRDSAGIAQWALTGRLRSRELLSPERTAHVVAQALAASYSDLNPGGPNGRIIGTAATG